MLPVAARTASRFAGRTATRNFSILRQMRESARAFEPHPFQRLPAASVKQASPDYSRLARMGMRTLTGYTIACSIVVYWPFAMRDLIDKLNGV